MAHPAVKDFVRVLSETDRSRTTTETFRDWAEMAYCALAERACANPAKAEKLESQFAEIEARYKPADRRRMGELLGIAVLALNKGGVDFLGQVAAEIGALDARLGQFFTPYEISRMMSELTLTDAPALIKERGFITLDEPAAGAGGMVLAAADTLEEKGFDPERHVWVRATELSRSTFHMAYIQITARGVAGVVIHGNSISREIFDTAYTAAAPVFVAANGHPFAEQIAARTEAEQAAEKRRNLLAQLASDHLADTRELAPP